MRRLFSLRHAEPRPPRSDDKLEDDASIGLTERGIAQARFVADGLSTVTSPNSSILASPSRRCVETAKIIADGLGTTFSLDRRLLDRAPNRALVQNRVEYNNWQLSGLLNPYDCLLGESIASHRARINSLLSDLLSDEKDGDRILITHGSSIEHIFGTMMGCPIHSMLFAHAACDHASGHVWSLERPRDMPPSALLRAANVHDFSATLTRSI